MGSILLQLEQQLAALSGQLGVPASLLVSAASLVLIATTLLRSFLSRSPRSAAPPSGGGETPISAPVGLPAPEQLARLIQVRAVLCKSVRLPFPRCCSRIGIAPTPGVLN